MVRTVHMNHFYHQVLIPLQMSDPAIEFSTKTIFLKNDDVQHFRKSTFLLEKKPLRDAPTAKKVVNTFRNIPDLLLCAVYMDIL